MLRAMRFPMESERYVPLGSEKTNFNAFIFGDYQILKQNEHAE
jgi:hypothetical protein